MKKHYLYIIIAFSVAVSLSSCSSYTPLTTDKYDVLYNAENITQIKVKFKNEIRLKMNPQDTIVSSVNRKGTARFNYVSRFIDEIPKNQKVKIIEANDGYFIVQFEKYDLQFIMVRSNRGNFIVSRDTKGQVNGTNYLIESNNPVLLFKLKKTSSVENISLKN